MRSQRARGARGHRASSRQSDEAPRRRAGPTVGGPQPATRPRYDFALMINLILSLRRTNASGGRAGRALHHGIDVDPRQPGERRQAHRDRVREGDETLAQAMAPRGAGVDEALAGHGDVDERERLGSWALDDPNQASEDAVKAYAGGAVRGLQPAVDSDPGRDRAILSFWWMGPAIYVACTTFAPLTGVRPERMGEWAPACARVPGARISWRWPSSCAAPPHTTRTGP